MSSSAAITHIHAEPLFGDRELRAQQFVELARLRALGMQNVETLSRWSTGDLTDQEAKALAGMGGFVMEYCRVAKAIRQVIVLELELSGQREAPDRDAIREPGEQDASNPQEQYGERRERGDSYERSDYDNGPLDLVIAKVRKALRADAPENDPFKPRKPRKTSADAAPVETAPVNVTPTDVTLDDVPPLKVANDGGKAKAAAAIGPNGDFDTPPVQAYNRAARRRAERATRNRGPPK
jgi:hypothetical protein